MVWRFLRTIFQRLYSIRLTSSAVGPELLPEFGDEEEFTRFIFSNSHFAASKGRVKPHAMLPLFSKTKNRFETSTFRVCGLSAGQIWNLGYAYAENLRQSRVIKARGTGSFSLATSRSLLLDVNSRPYPRHVDIIGWPAADKDVRLMKATEIADKLRLDIDPRA